MPSIGEKLYAKEVKVGELSFAKVFNGSIYNYSLPLSLQRESLYIKERFYEMEFAEGETREYQETILGLDFDTLVLHNNVVPVKLEWIYNGDVEDKSRVQLSFGVDF